jgi:hypothetical protein
MIQLDVEEYCYNCLDFEADVTKPLRDTETNTWSNTIIQCKYRKRCRAIKDYLTRKSREEASVVG